jgi:Cu(I)/Ag(I) efflux system membrane fusion protein
LDCTAGRDRGSNVDCARSLVMLKAIVQVPHETDSSEEMQAGAPHMKRRFIVVAALLVLLFLAFLAGRFTAGRTQVPGIVSRRILYYVDPMHPSYHSDKPGIAPDCGMALEPVYEGETGTNFQAPLRPGGVALTRERQQLIGLRVALATPSTGLRTIRTTGRIVPDDNHLYRIQAGFDGWVDTLADAPPGTIVRAEQVLATLFGPEIRTAQLNYIAFLSGIERVSQNQPDTDATQLNTSKRVSEEQLRLLGMGEKEIAQIAQTHHVSNSLNLVSPADGVVLSRSISPHQRFEKGAELYRIADLRKMWVVADVHGNEGDFKPGMHASVRVPELSRTFDASVSSTVPLFDETSRTLKIRLIVDNSALALRPEMFVDVEFETKLPEGLSVPADAVLDSGLRKIVYVETNDGVFEPRPVEVAGTFGNQAIVSGGIRQGERVVVSGNFLLDSESRMRASGNTADTAPATTPAVQAGAENEGNSTQAGAAVEGKVRDPVCGMALKSAEIAYQENYQGKTYSFCSASCRKNFLSDPARYAVHKSSVAAISASQDPERHD